MKTCATMLQGTKLERAKKCGNRVIPFVDQQPADQCYRCYSLLEDGGPKFDTGVQYRDKNDGGLPK